MIDTPCANCHASLALARGLPRGVKVKRKLKLCCKKCADILEGKNVS